jgi:hypothetical protein
MQRDKELACLCGPDLSPPHWHQGVSEPSEHVKFPSIVRTALIGNQQSCLWDEWTLLQKMFIQAGHSRGSDTWLMGATLRSAGVQGRQVTGSGAWVGFRPMGGEVP